MKRGLDNKAYTIVEVIIVLAVSSALLVSALLLVGGQQNKTQFNQSVRDIEQQVQDIINNVATGYYSRSTDFTCSNNAGILTISVGHSDLGSNKDCLFIGRIVQFNVGGNGENLAVYNIVGLRENGGEAITDLALAQPTILTGTTEHRTLKYGLRAINCGVGAVGFISTLGQPSGGNLESGSQNVELRSVTNVGCGGNELSNVFFSAAPVDEVKVCFNSGGTNQYADLIIGGSGRQTSTQLDIRSGQCP